jgi:D-glycero-alpha-D-manno-heptose-7-phosphate kinase
MIIVRTPFRVSLFGGGTDYPQWYLSHGGAVINTTINKYSYITIRKLPEFFPYKHRIRYYESEEVQSIDEIKHPSVRECAKFVGVTRGIELVHNADLPARSGLGSSSTFTVGMLHALRALKGQMIGRRQLAQDAIHVEQELIGETVGSQDQIAAAWGGFNHIQFDVSGTFRVDPIVMDGVALKEFMSSCLLVFTGFARTAHEVAKYQVAAIGEKTSQLQSMAELTLAALAQLTSSKNVVSGLSELLDLQWSLKKSLTDHISNEAIDSLYETAKNNGALGGKLLGAGGGGFLLLLAEPDSHTRLISALGDKLVVPFTFETTGSQIVYYAPS